LLTIGITAISTLTLNAVAGDQTAKSSGEAEIAMMDLNHDGRLSAEEHAAGAKAMFAKMDADHDGNVTAAEMDAAHESMMKNGHQPQNKMSSADKIKVVDANGDGILSAQEHEAGSRSMFEKMDRDHDGTLTAAEISAGHKTMMKKTN
jgi:Ca2+-binding EF-hand superfamily protein